MRRTRNRSRRRGWQRSATKILRLGRSPQAQGNCLRKANCDEKTQGLGMTLTHRCDLPCMDNVQADSLKRGAIKIFSTTTLTNIFSTLITLAPGRRADVCHPLIEWEAVMKISFEFDGTTREFVADRAWTIDRWGTPLHPLLKSQCIFSIPSIHRKKPVSGLLNRFTKN